MTKEKYLKLKRLVRLSIKRQWNNNDSKYIELLYKNHKQVFDICFWGMNKADREPHYVEKTEGMRLYRFGFRNF